MKLTGKCAVVSAASKGLGLAIAEKLAAEGANLHLCSRDEKAIQTVADRLSSKYGVHVHAYQVDVSEKQALSDWIEAIQATNASIDALVCNAGGPPSGDFLSISESQWEQSFQTNLMSVVRMLRGFYPLLRVGGGRVVTIASTSVKVPIAGLVLSNTYRTAVAGLMKTLSIEWGQDHILLNTVCPGRIQTDRLDELDAASAQRQGVSIDQLRAQIVKDIPLGRYGNPDELAQFSAYLLSPLNTYMTGIDIFCRWRYGESFIIELQVVFISD